jgi:hypothetical protein
MTRRTSIFAVVLLTGCSNSSAPPTLGGLDGRIVAGQNQQILAGVAKLPDRVVEEVVRMPLTGAIVPHPKAWERWLLPKLVYAQTVVGIKIPNVVLCAQEKHNDGSLVELIPLTRCVNTDAEGNAAWVFFAPTKAGSYLAPISGTLGNEIVTPDTARAVVLPDVPNPYYRSQSNPLQCSLAVIAADAVQDKYGNAIAYRIVSDKILTVQSLEPGAVGARTVAFTTSTDSLPPGGSSITRYFVTELRGADEVLVGHLQYRIPVVTGSCPDGTNQLRIEWVSGGTLVTF